MIILWFVASASLVASLAALYRARRAERRVAELSEQYWALRYQHGELRTQLQATRGLPASSTTPADVGPSRAPAEAFVPLSAVKR